MLTSFPASDILAIAGAVTLLASFVKGVVGFAMPMIMISGLTLFLPADQALAALIVPTLLANFWQAFRQGGRNVLDILREYRLYLAVVLIFIALSAQLVGIMPQAVLFICVGLPITLFAASMLIGRVPRIAPAHRAWADCLIGMVAGASGGLSGVWGPPTVAYLAAIGAPKERAIRVQGVVYFAGAVVLLLAHLRSGVLNAQTVPLSLAMVVPMLVGMMLGQAVQDRMDQVLFRKAMLAVLIVVGLNLVRRGVLGML